MKIVVDTDAQTLVIEREGESIEKLSLYSKQSFEVLSKLWTKVSWNERYAYTFTWLGRPMIQLPEDALRMQEVIYSVKPDVIVETGVAHGGSLIFYASLCAAIGKGRVIGVDIDIRSHNRVAIETHPLSRMLTLIEGDSTAPAIVERVRSMIGSDERVLVILDSNHTKAHVHRELEAYHPLVTSGSYIVATDGVMRDLHDVPRGSREWATDHPSAAALEFAAGHPEFVLEQPPWPFNESQLTENITYWPDAWLRRL